MTSAWYVCGSSLICSTRPTTTPAAFTGARCFRPADVVEGGVEVIAGRVADRCQVPYLEREKDNRGNADDDEMPTHRSIAERFILS